METTYRITSPSQPEKKENTSSIYVRIQF